MDSNSGKGLSAFCIAWLPKPTQNCRQLSFRTKMEQTTQKGSLIIEGALVFLVLALFIQFLEHLGPQLEKKLHVKPELPKTRLQ